MDNVRLIGLTGFAQAGKDTVGKILGEEYGFTRIAFADKLKELALRIDPDGPDGFMRLKTMVEMHGWEYAKTYQHNRMLLQNLGVAAREVLDPHIWVDAALNADWYDKYLKGLKTVVTDVRFLNEIQAIRNMGGKIVNVSRPGVKAVNSHVSEAEWGTVNPDTIIFNAGSLEDLRGEVKKVYEGWLS